ncbi:glycosyltransferase family 2 protein [Halosquirtibacter laminarini]|uniref:Glycosyltransferase family 2 protein n=1 Tax=Halosquirtibacter laminarini TaxID=3374600 RepID=A0AC61NFD7_9BACT|nr:glycosyltransferase family 2 protein [Prolixibacteraceae bacterium]
MVISPESTYLTIIIPVYNEEKSLKRVEQQMLEFINKTDKKIEVLFVNDGSSDQSQIFIEEICQNSVPFNYIQLEKNGGLSTALKAGIDTIQTPFIGYIDADLQTSPTDFLKLLEYCEENEMVTGIRIKRKDTKVKVLSSKIANKLRRWITNDGITDTGCPLKILQNDTAKRIPFFKGMHRFLAALVILQEGKVKAIDVSHFERIEGEAKYHLWNRLVGPFVDLIAFSWIKRRYIRYKIKSSSINNKQETR